MSTAVTVSPVQEVRGILESAAMKQQIKAALPAHVPVERFVRITVTALQNNPDLLNQNRHSLYGAAMKCAQAGLLPDGKEAALVPFKGQVQFMPMVEGLLKQVRNSGEVANISVQVVKENDTFDYELGDNERITHKPALRNRGEIIGAYSIVTLRNGEKSREWMDVDEIEAIRKRGRSGNGGPWSTDYGEMCRKTVFRRHYKRLPKSTDLDDIIQADDEANGIIDRAAAPAPAADVQTEQPAAPSRPSRLQAVVDAAGTDAEPIVIVDADTTAQVDTAPKPGDTI